MGRLKFIASMFRMVIREFNNVMGAESIQAIFRLIGEHQGEEIEKRMKGRYKIDKWTMEEFAEKFSKDVLTPVLGEGQSEVKVENNEIIVIIKVCPFQRARISISNKFYCTYTEGIIETAAKKALNNIEFKSEHLKADRNQDCIFKIKITK